MIDEVTALHPTCTHSGCARPAARCDLDHVINYAEGGPTCACNIQPLCRFHHRLKTHGGWKARFTTAWQTYAPGTVEWISRHGQLVRVPPTSLPGSNAWTVPRTTTAHSNAVVTPSVGTGPADAMAGTGSGAQADDHGDVEDYDDPSCPREATTTQRRWLRQDSWRREVNRLNRFQYHGTVLPSPQAARHAIGERPGHQPNPALQDRGELPF